MSIGLDPVGLAPVGLQVEAAGGASHPTTGALAAQSAVVAGTATHLTLHTASGALQAQAATIAGAAVHPHIASGTLTAQAATLAGEAEYTEAGGEHAASGALSAQAATVSGTAARLALHTTAGALAAQSATVAGEAAHYTLHVATGALIAESATVSGAAVGPGGEEVRRPQGGGRTRKPRRRVVEVDGRDIIVSSPEEAQALLDEIKERAKQTAELAIKRATAAKHRPVRKIVDDARRLLEVPTIKAPGLESYAQQITDEVKSLYTSTMLTVEVSALLAKRQRQEEDDEDVLLLIA